MTTEEIQTQDTYDLLLIVLREIRWKKKARRSRRKRDRRRRKRRRRVPSLARQS
jgi:hypothetical protein